MNNHASHALCPEDELVQLRGRLEEANELRRKAEFQSALYDALLYGLGRTLSLYCTPSVRLLIREMGRRIREYLEELGYHLSSANTMPEAVEQLTQFFTSHGFAELEVLEQQPGAIRARWHQLLGLRAYERIVAAGGETFISCPMNAVLNDTLAVFGKELVVRQKHFNLPAQWVESVEEITDMAPEPASPGELQLDPERLLKLEKEQSRQLRLRDDFIRIASHELSTPLAAMKLALRRVDNVTVHDEKVKHAIVVMHRQQRRLELLVTEMLDTTRLQIGRMQIVQAPVDLVRLTCDVVELLSLGNEAKSGQIRMRGVPSLVGQWDAARIEQVVTNILTNAIKYGNEKPIHVEITQVDGCARIKVRDEGIGIPAEAMDRIFKPFERAVPVEMYGGLGLGLYIARSFIEMHRGTIRVESTLGAGSTFTIDLPLESDIESGVLVEIPQRQCSTSS